MAEISTLTTLVSFLEWSGHILCSFFCGGVCLNCTHLYNMIPLYGVDSSFVNSQGLRICYPSLWLVFLSRVSFVMQD